jgi:putative ABC transport system substrate-binding protein
MVLMPVSAPIKVLVETVTMPCLERSGRRMKRRDFITLFGGAAATWPLTVRAQQIERMRRISVLMPYVESDADAQQWTKAFGESLREFGWIDGRNIRLEYRWAGPSPDRLRADAAEMVRLNPDVLMAAGTSAVVALQHETRSIPIVFANVADPVGQGIIASLAKPGSNTTGFGAFEFSIAGKWVQAIKEIAPSVIQIGVIVNPETGPFYQSFLPFVETASRQLGVKQIVIPIHDSNYIGSTLEQLAKESNTGVIVIPAALFTDARESIITTTARLRLPTIYPYSFFAKRGGLLSYGFDVRDMFQRAAAYVDRILKGAKPADLPAQQPTKFELVVNLKAAKAIGLTIPQSFLARADEVIE